MVVYKGFTILYILVYMYVGLAVDFLKDYVHVNIGSMSLSANHNITQVIDVCQDHEKEYK